ncbi:MAG: hypothetical protein CVU97_00760 [Firmicutes bacterium HGW-Firmicutes-21]|nr:MAG: hypothetical protein CVU97_00760 [Firmicutes bacterium HGW-Firmicutes-21]
MLNKKVFLFIIAILILMTPLLTACGEAVENTSKDAISMDEDDSFPLSKKVFDTTIKVFCVASTRHLYGEQQFVPNDESKTAVVNDAVARRNDYIEQEYGIKIEIATAGYPSPGEEVANSITSGLDEYQIVADAVYRMLPNATKNYYWSLEKDLKLDRDWWDQNAIENLSITDKTYFVAGDALITDDDHTYLILYNKKMYEENTGFSDKYGNIYDFVRDGKWTYDAMYEMAKAVSRPDDQGQWTTTEGTYGLLGESYGTGILVAGSGITSAEKTSDGGIQLMVDSEKSTRAFDKVFNMLTDTSATIRVEQLGEGGWGKISNMFIDGKGLFYCTSASTITSIKTNTAENKADFGVLPIPKFDEDQDKYYNGINIYQSSVMGVPTTNVQKYDATIYLLEALGYYSKNTPGGSSVTDAYYEITLKLQGMDTSDDEEMLDIVFRNRLYDIGAIYDWGGSLLGIYANVMRSGSNTLASSFDAIKEGARIAMEETIEEYSKITT